MQSDNLQGILESILAPMIEQDDGKLFWVPGSFSPTRLHLTGKFSGCPGNYLVETSIITPLLRRLDPNLELIVSSGPLIPEGAVRVVSRPNHD